MREAFSPTLSVRSINSPGSSNTSSPTGRFATARPAPGQEFLGWSGDALGTNSRLSIVMDSSKTITARFTRRPRLDIVSCPGRPLDGVLQGILTGDMNQNYVIEASTALGNGSDWSPVVTLTNSFGRVNFTNVIDRERRYYRGVAVER